MKKWNEWLNESGINRISVKQTETLNDVVSGEWTADDEEGRVDVTGDVTLDTQTIDVLQYVKFGDIHGNFTYHNMTANESAVILDFNYFPKFVANMFNFTLNTTSSIILRNTDMVRDMLIEEVSLDLNMKIDKTIEITELFNGGLIDQYVVTLDFEDQDVKEIFSTLSRLLAKENFLSFQFLIKGYKKDDIQIMLSPFIDCEIGSKRSLEIIAESKEEGKIIHDLCKIYSGSKDINETIKKKYISKLSDDIIHILLTNKIIDREYIHSIRGNIASNRFNL